MIARQQKITFGEMRAGGVRGVLIYRADHNSIQADRMTASLRTAGDLGDQSVTVPELKIAPINELLCRFDSGRVVSMIGQKINFNEMPVDADREQTIVRHGAAPKIRREHYRTLSHRKMAAGVGR